MVHGRRMIGRRSNRRRIISRRSSWWRMIDWGRSWRRIVYIRGRFRRGRERGCAESGAGG